MVDALPLLQPAECALLLEQAGRAFGVGSTDSQILPNNTVALARTATAFELPIVVSTSAAKVYSAPLMPAIHAALPDVTVIERRTLALWGADYYAVGKLFDMLQVWAEMAGDLRTHAIPQCNRQPPAARLSRGLDRVNTVFSIPPSLRWSAPAQRPGPPAGAAQKRADPPMAIATVGQGEMLNPISHTRLFRARRRGLPMPVIGGPLSDTEIAAISNYVIGHVGGKTVSVTAADVKSAR
jgi:hypothetical protein